MGSPLCIGSTVHWKTDDDTLLFSVKKNQTKRVEKIIVSENRATIPSVPYSHLEPAPSESTADDDMDSIGSDLVLADMSDSDTRSVDFLLDDFGEVTSTSRGFPKVSVWLGDVIDAERVKNLPVVHWKTWYFLVQS